MSDAVHPEDQDGGPVVTTAQTSSALYALVRSFETETDSDRFHTFGELVERFRDRLDDLLERLGGLRDRL